MTEVPNPEAPRRARLQALTILLGSSLTVMAGAAVSPALVDIDAAFASVPNHEFLVKLILTLPAFFIALCAPIMGVLCDRVGRIRILVVGIVGYAFAGCSALVLSDLYAILAGRAVLGVAVAAVLTSCTTLIGDYYHGHERDRFMGLQAAFMSFSGVLFPVASGVLVGFSWRHPFWVYVVSLAVLPGVLLYLREPSEHRHIHHSAEHTGNFPVYKLLMIYSMASVQMVVFYQIPVQITFHLEQLVGATGLQAGLVLSFASLCIGVWSMMFHRIRNVWTPPVIVVGCLLFMAVGYILLYRAQGWGGILVGIVVAAVGLGVLGPNLTTWALGFTPERLRGRIVGGMAASFFVGQFLAPLLAEPIIRWKGTAGVFGVIGAGLFVLSGVFLVGHWIRRVDTPE